MAGQLTALSVLKTYQMKVNSIILYLLFTSQKRQKQTPHRYKFSSKLSSYGSFNCYSSHRPDLLKYIYYIFILFSDSGRIQDPDFKKLSKIRLDPDPGPYSKKTPIKIGLQAFANRRFTFFFRPSISGDCGYVLSSILIFVTPYKYDLSTIFPLYFGQIVLY